MSRRVYGSATIVLLITLGTIIMAAIGFAIGRRSSKALVFLNIRIRFRKMPEYREAPDLGVGRKRLAGRPLG